MFFSPASSLAPAGAPRFGGMIDFLYIKDPKDLFYNLITWLA